MLIPWPLFVAFYQSVSSLMATQPEQFMSLSQHLLPALAKYVPVGEQFLWLNLARPDPLYILPLLAVVTTWIQQKMMVMSSTDPQAQSMNQTMGLMMPLFMGWITLSFAAGLAIYWVTFNIVGIIQQYFTTGWGELGKMIPDPILRVLPGPVPVQKTNPPAPAAAPKRVARARLTTLEIGDEGQPKKTTRRSASTANGNADEQTEQAAPSSATSLPSRKSTRKPKTSKP
jgi:hypothetical protein